MNSVGREFIGCSMFHTRQTHALQVRFYSPLATPCQPGRAHLAAHLTAAHLHPLSPTEMALTWSVSYTE
jgi:hypothetical protein